MTKTIERLVNRYERALIHSHKVGYNASVQSVQAQDDLDAAARWLANETYKHVRAQQRRTKGGKA